MNRIRIMRKEKTLAACAAETEALLYFQGEYEPGDVIVFESEARHIVASVDHTLSPAGLYMPGQQWSFRLPLEGDLPQMYPPLAFAGDRHLLTLREDTDTARRNLALNPLDQRHDSGAYPHITANVETRDESVFFARNVIDGLHIADSHGIWPYTSWGIGGQADAAITLAFGRAVQIDSMALYLRADFEHSGYWVRGTLTVSDGYTKTFPLQKRNGPQMIDLEGTHTITWARLDQLIKDASPKPYPSLRQWEVFGQDAD